MKKLWRWLLQLFSSPRRHQGLNQIFRPVDPGKVIETLGVDAAAQSAGRHELPQTSSTALDATESRIAHFFDEEAQSTALRANQRVLLYRRRIEHHDLQADLNEAKSAIAAFETKTQGFLEESRDSLSELLVQRKALRSEHEQFKASNGISRSAHYPESRFLYVALLVLMVVFESLANSVFFAAGSDFGVLGGWIEAALFGAVNVVVAFLITLAGVRNILHANAGRRFIGFVAVLALIVWVPAFNLFVAHYRDLLGTNPENAERAAVQAFLGTPLDLSVDSWLLFALGTIFAVIAIFDALAIDDPYPGFGQLSRRYQQAQTEYLEEKHALKNRLANLRDDSLRALDILKERLEEKQAELLDLKSLCQDVIGECRRQHELLAQTCNVVVSRYRELNIVARSSLPPARFENGLKLSSDALLGLPDAPDENELKGQTQEAVRAMKIIDLQRQSIGERYAERLKNLDEEIRSLEHGSV